MTFRDAIDAQATLAAYREGAMRHAREYLKTHPSQDEWRAMHKRQWIDCRAKIKEARAYLEATEKATQ